MGERQEKIRVAAVFPCHNRRELTLQCLRSLDRINRDGFDLHIVVVDDGSTDGTSESIEKEFPAVEIIKADGSLWFTEGTNVGVRRALEKDPKYVLMMNDDQVFDADFLKFMIETAEKKPRSVVGSLLLLWDTPHKLFQVSPVWDTWAGGWRHWQKQTVWTIPRKPWKVEIIVGNCVLVPSQAIRENGLMNSKHYPNFGDAEYTPRLRRNGWQLLIDPRARVFCQPNTLPAKVARMNLRQKFRALFVDLKNVHNLRRRFYAYWEGAPSRWQGMLAFFVFFFRLAAGKNFESAYAETVPEKPMAETFAAAQLED